MALSRGNSGSAAVVGERFTKASPAKTFPAGRVCVEPGCATVLSIYNATKHCSAHAPRAPVWARGRRRERSAAG